jgi:hypothetical protein
MQFGKKQGDTLMKFKEKIKRKQERQYYVWIPWDFIVACVTKK